MPSMFITPTDQIIWHDQRPTHRAVAQAVTAAQTVENMAWDAVDHISEAIHDGESWSGAGSGGDVRSALVHDQIRRERLRCRDRCEADAMGEPMKRMLHAFFIAIIAGLLAEISVQSSALELTAYGWFPFSLALCVFVITFATMRACKSNQGE